MKTTEAAMVRVCALVFIALAATVVFGLTGCTTTQQAQAPKRTGYKVECVSFENGAALELCQYPAGVWRFANASSLACTQVLDTTGGPQ